MHEQPVELDTVDLIVRQLWLSGVAQAYGLKPHDDYGDEDDE